MAYNDFSLADVEQRLGVTVRTVDLFPGLAPRVVPTWLEELLARGRELALLSEKARSEFIVAPILLAVRELTHRAVAIFSGQRLDVNAEQGLVGECDFILAATDPVPLLRAPLVTIVEARRNDIELGLGQCTAQMIGAQLFNQNAGRPTPVVCGCVTTGDDWQFLRLSERIIAIHRPLFYLDNLGGILAAFQALLAQCRVPAPANGGTP